MEKKILHFAQFFFFLHEICLHDLSRRRERIVQ